ncbi:MAG TPA: fibronectin type III domain-containing protein [Acidobacteriaceae bacterium]|nr:fibronectin type III domain-containing protein [Acidobacteriaceae bacterium]
MSPCAQVVARIPVEPRAEGEAVDTLPPALTSGPAKLLAYRVQLRNPAGRTAGPSPVVYALAGAVPAAVKDIRAHEVEDGVVLEWTPQSGTRDAVVEFERETVDPTPEAKPAKDQATGDVLSSLRQTGPVRLRAGEVGAEAQGDPGGTVDRGTALGHTYRYTAWRVRSVMIGGHLLEMSSAPSQTVTIQVKGAFVPQPPQGLVAAPAVGGDGSAARPAIDLSWEPDIGPHIAGYRVYRQAEAGTEAGEWRQVNSALVTVAAYHDATVAAGGHYAYRVTAVNEAGLESAPGNVIEETAAAAQ